MNVTLGVPRIKELINAAKSISTPIITAALQTEDDLRVARIVKARIEKTTLGEVSDNIREEYDPSMGCLVRVALDTDAIERLQVSFLTVFMT